MTPATFSAADAQLIRYALRKYLEEQETSYRRDGRSVPDVHRQARAFASTLDEVDGPWRVTVAHGGPRLAKSAPAADGGPGSSPLTVDFVNLDEAAHRLGMSRSTVERRIKEGKLQSVHDGRRHLVPVAAIEAYIEGLRT